MTRGRETGDMQEPQRFVFGPFTLDLADERLWRAHEPVRLTHKAFGVLRCLASRPQRLVTKDELLATVWPGTVVSEAVLTTAVRELRQALDDDARSPNFIQTVHGRGYRFIPSVRAATPFRSAGAVPASAREPGVGSHELVGREAEWERLQKWYEKARGGARQIGFIAGEPGIGKTALAESFVSSVVGEETVLVGRGQCVEHYGAGEPYLPILEALGRLGREAGEGPLVELLRSQAPSWLAHLPALLSPDQREKLARTVHQATPARMLRELAEALEVLTAQQPLVLVLEDLHWSDTATLEWLAYVARRPDPARLLVLATYRPVEAIVHSHPLREVVAELRQHPQCSVLVPDYLPEEAITAYLRRRCTDVPRLNELAEILHRRTGGHPLFVVAIVDELARRWPPQADGWPPPMPKVLERVGELVPTSVRQFIEGCVERLPDEDQALFEAASAIGTTFSAPALAAGLSGSEEAIETRCAAWAHRGEFLLPAGTETWPDGTVSARYRFRHSLYQEVLYARVASARRARLHQRIGRRLELGHENEAQAIATELAAHFEQGHDFPRATRYRQQAAENAMRRSAYSEALTHLREGLELLWRLPESRERAERELEFQLTFGKALMATKGWGASEAEQVYRRARELCEQAGDTCRLCLALWGLVAVSIVRAELQKTRALSHELLRLAREQENPVFLVAAHMELAGAAFGLGELSLASRHFEQADAQYDRAQHRTYVRCLGVDLGVFSRAWGAHALWHMGYPDQACARSHDAVALARNLSHPLSEAVALAYAAMVHQFRRETETAQALANDVETLCVEHGFMYYLAWASIIQGWCKAVHDRNDEGVAQIREGIDDLRATGGRRSLPYYRALLAEACSSVGQTDKGFEALGRAFADLRQTGECWWEAELHRLEGELLLRKSAATQNEAEPCLRRALRTARARDTRSLELRAGTSLCRLLRWREEREPARELLAGIYKQFTEGFETTDLREASTLLAILER